MITKLGVRAGNVAKRLGVSSRPPGKIFHSGSRICNRPSNVFAPTGSLCYLEPYHLEISYTLGASTWQKVLVVAPSPAKYYDPCPCPLSISSTPSEASATRLATFTTILATSTPPTSESASRLARTATTHVVSQLARPYLAIGLRTASKLRSPRKRK